MLALIRDEALKLRGAVREAYSAAAERPWEKHAFPAGQPFAESLGYPRDLLVNLPPVSVDAFAGVSNVSVFAEIPAGAKEGDAFLDEFHAAGFREAVILRTSRNARTKHPGVLAAEVRVIR